MDQKPILGNRFGLILGYLGDGYALKCLLLTGREPMQLMGVFCPASAGIGKLQTLNFNQFSIGPIILGPIKVFALVRGA